MAAGVRSRVDPAARYRQSPLSLVFVRHTPVHRPFRQAALCRGGEREGNSNQEGAEGRSRSARLIDGAIEPLSFREVGSFLQSLERPGLVRQGQAREEGELPRVGQAPRQPDSASNLPPSMS
jgi:hypothetical protein